MSALGRFAAGSSLSTSRRAWIGRASKAAKETVKRTAASGTRAGGPSHQTSDARYEMMKQILFQEEARQPPQLSDEDMDRHMTILRAQKIYRMGESAKRRSEREGKFEAMRRAYDALEALDERLFDGACQKEANMTFPRQMRVATETPPTRVWDYLK